MGYVLLGAALGLIPTLMLLFLLVMTIRNHEKDRSNWSSERENLLNRCMTKEWQSYQMMTLSNPTSPFPFEPYAGEYIPGMSDAEELKRMGRDISQAEGIGDMNFDDYDQEMIFGEQVD